MSMNHLIFLTAYRPLLWSVVLLISCSFMCLRIGLRLTDNLFDIQKLWKKQEEIMTQEDRGVARSKLWNIIKWHFVQLNIDFVSVFCSLQNRLEQLDSRLAPTILPQAITGHCCTSSSILIRLLPIRPWFYWDICSLLSFFSSSCVGFK